MLKSIIAKNFNKLKVNEINHSHIYILSAVLALFSILFNAPILLFLLTMLFQFLGVVYALRIQEYRNCFLFLIFNFTFFIFLQSRFFVTIFFKYYEGYGGYLNSGESLETIQNVFILYLISLIFVHLGYFLIERNTISKKSMFKFSSINLLKINRSFFNELKLFFEKKEVQIVLISLFVLTAISKAFYYWEFSQFVKSVGYSESYLTDFTSNLKFIYLLSRMFEVIYFMNISFKKISLRRFILLSLVFIGVSFVEVISGRRMQFMQNLLVVCVLFCTYYLVLLKSKTKKKLLVILVILLPILIIILQSVSQIRYGSNDQISLVRLVSKFFYDQGISFKPIVLSINNRADFPHRGYSIGPIIDYFNVFLGNSVPARSSVESALNGYVFSDASSYISNHSNYLKGISLGSSYIAELFIDGHYLWLVLGSLILGGWIKLLERFFNSSNPFIAYFSILIAREVIILPRSQYLKFIFGISPTNIILLILTIFLAIFLSFSYWLIEQKVNN